MALNPLSVHIQSCFKSFFFANCDLNRLSIALIFVLWLYLFLPFRPIGFPLSFDQVEEWVFSSILLSLIGLLLCISFIKQKQIVFRFTLFDLLILCYLVYILMRFEEYPLRQDQFLRLYSLTLLYITVKITDKFHLRFILPLLVVSLIIQVIVAFYYHESAWTRIPVLTGIFHNTGIWGCFVSLVLVGICGVLLFSRQNKLLLSLFLLVSLALLVYSQSRAAWIGAFGGIAFLSLLFLWRKFGRKMLLPAVISLLLSIPVFIFVTHRLYVIKPVSADGRLLIWKISSQLLEERPWVGIGVEKFRSKYMNYQADYFIKNPTSPFSQIADEVADPFSEPLKITIEQGIVGLAFFLSLFFTALLPVLKRKEYNCKTIFSAMLISLLIFSCFSYPYSFIQFYFLTFAFLALLAKSGSGYRISVRSGKILSFAFLLIILLSGYVSVTGITYTVNLKKLHHQIVHADINAPKSAVTALSLIEPVLKKNPIFLISYARFLSLDNEHEHAIEKLVESQYYHASYYTCMELGRNYDRLGDTKNALFNWQKASYMIPSRFEPLYLQIDANRRNGQHSIADSLTTIFLQKKRKVDNIRIDRMIRDVKENYSVE